jgi:hypothetical protein
MTGTVPALLENRRPGGCRFISGSPAEFIRLFGHPPPVLPAGEIRQGVGEIIQAVLPAELETQTAQYLTLLGHSLDGGKEVEPRGEEDFLQVLVALLRHVARSDRRAGLLNLFWLAYAQWVAQVLDQGKGQGRGPEGVKRLWPLFTGILRRGMQGLLADLSPGERRVISFSMGQPFNWGLVDAVLQEQAVLTQRDVRTLDLGATGVLAPQFSLEGEVLHEVAGALERAAREIPARARREGSLPLLPQLPAGVRADYSSQAHPGEIHPFDPLFLAAAAADQEFRDSLTASRTLRFALERAGGLTPLLGEVGRILASLRRAECVQFLQEFVVRVPAGLDDSQIKNLYLEGRLYRYSRRQPIVNNFRKVVVLIADIREFTSTSESAISERELTEQLYEIFDPLVHIVNNLGGTVDKFTGDGMMVTFGAVHADAGPELQALRSAIAIQEAVDRLRRAGRTSFRMGLSIHAGRAFVATFMHDGRTCETTVIGRQVNFTARLSSSQSLRAEGKDEADHRAAQEKVRRIPSSSREAVQMDRAGNFLNVGLATSQAFFLDLKAKVPMEEAASGGTKVFSFTDPYLKCRVLFHYVGDALFKGFRETTAVYGVSWLRERKSGEEAG